MLRQNGSGEINLTVLGKVGVGVLTVLISTAVLTAVGSIRQIITLSSEIEGISESVATVGAKVEALSDATTTQGGALGVLTQSVSNHVENTALHEPPEIKERRIELYIRPVLVELKSITKQLDRLQETVEKGD